MTIDRADRGRQLTVISSNVDLPAPFGPTNAIRLSQSTPSSRFSYKSPPSCGCANETLANGKTGSGTFWHSGKSNLKSISLTRAVSGQQQPSIDNLLFGFGLLTHWSTYHSR